MLNQSSSDLLHQKSHSTPWQNEYPCSIERLAYYYAALADAHRSIDNPASYNDPVSEAEAEVLMSRLGVEMDRVREAVSCQQGCTLLAAMFHLMVADCEADLLDIDSDPTLEEIRAHLQRVKNNLHSAVTILENMSGMSRDKFGGVYLMPSRTRMHTHEGAATSAN